MVLGVVDTVLGVVTLPGDAADAAAGLAIREMPTLVKTRRRSERGVLRATLRISRVPRPVRSIQIAASKAVASQAEVNHSRPMANSAIARSGPTWSTQRYG